MLSPSENPDTLRGYDIVLSLSQEALNAQFQELYHKPLPGGKVPPPPGLPGFQPGPVPEYYINHNLLIFPPPEQTPAKTDPGEEPIGPQSATNTGLPPLGLRAHMDCPQFAFHPDHPNTIIMSITFKAVPWTPELARLMGDDPSQPPAEEEVTETTINAKGEKETTTTRKRMSHSKMSYVKSMGNAVAIKVDDWTASWDVSLGVKDIENIMEVVDASRNPNKATLLTPAAERQLEAKYKSVDTTKFTAASIFCLFQTKQISKTFELTAGGTPLPKSEARDAMAARISTYLGELHHQHAGTATAETPYVLGYGIKAATPTLEQVNSDLHAKTATPAYFIPRRFDVTTTPSKTDDDKKFTKGTLNFCMQTYREKPDDQVALPVTDDGNGHFHHPFFSTIQTPAFGLAGSDGVLGFSRQIFRNLWLYSFLDRFKADPNALLKSAADSPDNLNVGRLTVGLNSFDREVWPPGPGVKASTTFKASVLVDRNMKLPGYYQNSVDTKRIFTGDSTTAIRYSSDLQVDAAKATKDGAYRRVFLDFFFHFSLSGSTEAKISDAWEQVYQAKLRSQYKVGYTLQPGEGGIWSLTKDNARTNVPAKDAEQVTEFNTVTEDQDGTMSWHSDPSEYTQLTLGSDKSGTVLIAGIVDYFSNRPARDAYLDATPLKNMVSSVHASGSVHLDDIENSMKGIFENLRTTVILPAGNVFTFKTTDTDAEGHMYTSLTYRPATTLEKVTRA